MLINVTYRKVFCSVLIISAVYVINFRENSVTEVVDKEIVPCDLDTINSPLTPQDDPCMISIIRKTYLVPPSTLPLNLTKKQKKNPSFGQSQRVLEILNNKRKGFFIEAGALDGESYSNTIYMERDLEWEGLLVEANPTSYEKVVSKHRKAWLVPAALSNSPFPKVVTFDQSWVPDVSQIAEAKVAGTKKGLISVQCFPIYSILLALNRTTVDFFSLDVEGFELDVLRTIPWDKTDIKTLAVEYSHVKEGREAVKSFMESKGYTVEGEITLKNLMAYDLIFVKKP